MNKKEELSKFILKDEEIIKLYDGATVSLYDYEKLIDSIKEVLKFCTIDSLTAIFVSAMEASGSPQDMSNFDPMCHAYAELFIRQIIGACKQVEYDTLLVLYTNIIGLVKDKLDIEEA